MAAEVEIVLTAQDNASGVLSGIGTAFGNLGSIVSGIRDAFDLLAGAFSSVVDFGSQFVAEAVESQDAVANLEATLRSMGNVTGLSSQQLQEMAGALQEVTRFSDETIINGEAMLLTFGNIGGEIFPQATTAMLDLAAKFGSVEQASVMLGKALNDPIAGVTALRRVGVQLTDQQEEAIKKFMELGDIESAQRIILDELARQVGGLAQAYGDTFAGKVEILKNRFGEIKETIGTALLPILSDLMDFVIDFMPTLEEFGDKFADVLYALQVGLSEGNWVFFESALDRLDSFAADVFQSIANSIDTWLAGGGPEELSDKFISWLDGVGATPDAQSKALVAASNILRALGRALVAVDWSGVAKAMDSAMGRAIDNYDWASSGDSFGKMIEDLFTGSLQAGDSDFITALGDAISEFFLGAIQQPDWTSAKNTFVAILKQYVFNPIGDWIKNNWISILFPFIPTDAQRQNFYNMARDVLDGFVAGMNSIELNMTNWVRDHIVNPVKAFLGIASPSTVFAQIGRDIMSGWLSGLMSGAASLLAFVNGIIADILALIDPILNFFGIGDSGSAGGGGGTGTPPPDGSGSGSSGTVVNQYFAGATINVGSWDKIAYDCVYPNPFIASSGGQLGGGGGGGHLS